MISVNLYNFWELDSKIQKQVVKENAPFITDISTNYVKNDYCESIKKMLKDMEFPNAIYGVFREVDGLVLASLFRYSGSKQKAKFISNAGIVLNNDADYRHNLKGPLAEVLEYSYSKKNATLEDLISMLAEKLTTQANEWLKKMKEDKKYAVEYLSSKSKTHMLPLTDMGLYMEDGTPVTLHIKK